MKVNLRIVAAAAAMLATFGVAAAETAQPAAPKAAHKAVHKHPVAKAPYVYAPPPCTLLTCLTPVNTGP